MKRHTEREQMRTVAERWRKAYPQDTCIVGRSSTNAVYARLAALDAEQATADDVATIIGNHSWVRPPGCDECGEESWDAVQLGQEPDYESDTATICPSCLRKALALAEAVEP